MTRTGEWNQWSRSSATETRAKPGVASCVSWLDPDSRRERPLHPQFSAGNGRDIFIAISRRMLAGKDPSAPAARTFGQPWYDLVEHGRGIATEVKQWEWAPEQKIAINRGIWTILEKNSRHGLYRDLSPESGCLSVDETSGWNWLLERKGERSAKVAFRSARWECRSRFIKSLPGTLPSFRGRKATMAAKWLFLFLSHNLNSSASYKRQRTA